jgi:hypothetical protein
VQASALQRGNVRRPLLLSYSPGLAFLAAALGLGAACAACHSALRLEPPEIARNLPRDGGARVEIEPIVLSPGARVVTISSGETILPHPDAAAAVTAGMRAEVRGRALEGGDPGGYTVSCTLERFAVRDSTNITTTTFAVLYIDLACTAVAAQTGARVWQGELRGRGCARGFTAFEKGASGITELLDRTMSDVTREMASDLVVRALGLRSAGRSARVFDDANQRATVAGLDDGPLAAAELGEDIGVVGPLEKADGGPGGVLALIAESTWWKRAEGWNAIAMAAGPGEPWPVPGPFVRDGDDRVRFYQYKALAREASPATLAALEAAAKEEGGSLDGEMARDALASGGLGFARRPNGASANGSAVTNGTTTSP